MTSQPLPCQQPVGTTAPEPTTATVTCVQPTPQTVQQVQGHTATDDYGGDPATR